METEALRTLTLTAFKAFTKATLWPNGLGFDAYGWEYSYSENAGDWCALNRRRDPRRFGRGATPAEAKKNARPVL